MFKSLQVFIGITTLVLLGSVLYWSFSSNNSETLKEVELPKQTRLTITEKDFFWSVPNNTNTVYIQVYDDKEKLLNQYNISRYITLNPGQSVRIIAR